MGKIEINNKNRILFSYFSIFSIVFAFQILYIVHQSFHILLPSNIANNANIK